MMDILACPILVPLLPPEKKKKINLVAFSPRFLLQWKVLPLLNPSLSYVNEHIF